MKKFYQTIRFSLIIPLVFITVLCCCGGKAHAATVGVSFRQSMAMEQNHACCPTNKSSNIKKCNCHNIFGTTESGILQKGIVSQKTNWLPHPDLFVNGINRFVIAFISSGSLSFYRSLAESSQSTPPIYLLNRVFRL